MEVTKYFINKKAQIAGRKMIFYIVFAFIAAITFLLIVYMVSSDKSDISVIYPGLEDYLLTQRFLLSQECFAYQDDSGRTYPWTIDIRKFTQNNLDECYTADKTNVKAFRLTLSYGASKTTLSTKNWEGFLKKAETKKVEVYDQGRKTGTGELFIEIQYEK